MKNNDLNIRTKEFAKAVIRMANDLPNNRVGWTITDQIVRSSTSVAANYRAVSRAKSDKDFIYKMAIVIEEADDTHFWLDMVDELNLINKETQKSNKAIQTNDLDIKNLIKEANELVAIFVSSTKTIKKRLNKK